MENIKPTDGREKKLIKITEEQYHRVLKKLDEESTLVNKLDKNTKKSFSAIDITEKDGYQAIIKPKNTSVPSLPKSVTTPSKMTIDKPLNEEVEDDQIKEETAEFIKFLYRKIEHLSNFWEEHGLNYVDICDDLLAKNLIISKNGSYELAKTTGDPKLAVQSIENELKELIEKKGGEQEPELETEDSAYPIGSENDLNSPLKDKDVTTPIKTEKPELESIAHNGEIAILQGPDKSLYVFDYWGIDKKEFVPYASVTRRYVGKDETGDPQYDYDENFDIDDNVISNYVNDNLSNISKGVGLDDVQTADLVKIDEPLRQELIKLHDKHKDFVKALHPIEEAVIGDETFSQHQDTSNKISSSLGSGFLEDPNKIKKTPEEIAAKLKQLKDKESIRRKESGELEEMTSSASSGAFTGPMSMPVIKKNMPEVPVVAETVDGNFGYDTPGGLTLSLKSKGKTKAEKTPQWAGGSFVKQPECSKPNNNKQAQNGGCNSGASSLKLTKPSGSINAPSLGENINLTPQQNNHLDRINTSTLSNVIKTINNHKYTKESIPSQYKKSEWWDKMEYNDKNGMWYPITDKKMVKDLSNNAVSNMNENKIFEAISKKTGKSIDEIKKIIKSKNNKA